MNTFTFGLCMVMLGALCLDMKAFCFGTVVILIGLIAIAAAVTSG